MSSEFYDQTIKMMNAVYQLMLGVQVYPAL